MPADPRIDFPLGPVPDAFDLPPGRAEQRHDHLVSELREQAAPKKPSLWKRLRSRPLLLAPAAAVVLAGCATGVALLTQPVTDFDSLQCLSAPARGAPGVIVFKRPNADDPVKVCREAWALGQVPGRRGQPPAMTACVQDRRVVVFPSRRGSTCRSLGYESLPEDYTARSVKFFELREDLRLRFFPRPQTPAGNGVTQVGPPPCQPSEPVQRAIRDGLRELGVRGWRLERSIGSLPGACVSALDWDGLRRVVVLVGNNEESADYVSLGPGGSEDAGAFLSAAVKRRADAAGLRTSTGCATPAVAVRAARAELRLRRLRGWSIVTAPAGPDYYKDGDCLASIETEPLRRIITVLPFEDDRP